MRLALLHARYQLLETVRIPVAVVGSAFFPAAAMLFFVVPFTGKDPVGATYATAAMVTFSVMSANIFQYGIGAAEDRAHPWDPYTRTLPAGPTSRFAGRILAGLALTYLSLLPVVVIGATLTEARVSAAAFLLALAIVTMISVPFTLLGLSIGYSMPSKAAIVVAQVVFFPLAFGGGLLSAPDQAPGFVEAVAPFLPTRGAVELMWAAVGDYSVNSLSVVMLGVWVVLLAVLAGWAYRRDEGRRFS
ncbi:ABC transporter permease [Micromonospora peucetia]|uniref:ABC transporter permease n=1 Tax=Micromonospora peucetia TaxID=47871 RepID=A0A1C6UQJ7_9ACTN|nr:ABC transporter permease [Micromonospora peucetia]MCX4387214.1 ABC transporter permease [Micromonospora peucetia]WSA34643.1 ABC transporter permease [Micromonospora peucetia]SCL56306.1 ABC-2 type transport system permease protein [Micromonospora peucetia]